MRRARSRRQLVELQDAARVSIEDFALGFFIGGETADGIDLLDTGARGTLTDGIGAVAAVKEFVLVAREEGAGMIFVANERLIAGVGGEVAIHIGIIGEQAIGNAAGDDRAGPTPFSLR